MSATWHPTIEQIADHDAGSASAEDAQQVAEHLADCAQCRGVSEQLGQVSEALGVVGASIEPIPADVADRLDAALATAASEREAGVPSLAERRDQRSVAGTSSSDSTGPTARRGRWVLGSAAAVAVFAIGAAIASNGLQGGSGRSDSATSSADQEAGAHQDSSAGSGSSAPQAAPTTKDSASPEPEVNRLRQTPSLDAANVSQFAGRLSRGEVGAMSVAVSRCRVPNPAAAAASQTPVSALVSYEGRSAVLQVERSPRRLTVYACPGPARVLYRSSY